MFTSLSIPYSRPMSSTVIHLIASSTSVSSESLLDTNRAQFGNSLSNSMGELEMFGQLSNNISSSSDTLYKSCSFLNCRKYRLGHCKLSF